MFLEEAVVVVGARSRDVGLEDSVASSGKRWVVAQYLDVLDVLLKDSVGVRLTRGPTTGTTT